MSQKQRSSPPYNSSQSSSLPHQRDRSRSDQRYNKQQPDNKRPSSSSSSTRGYHHHYHNRSDYNNKQHNRSSKRYDQSQKRKHHHHNHSSSHKSSRSPRRSSLERQSRGKRRDQGSSSSSPGAYRRDYQNKRASHKSSSHNFQRSRSNTPPPPPPPPQGSSYSRKSKSSYSSKSSNNNNNYSSDSSCGDVGKNIPSSQQMKSQKQQREIPLVRVINGNGSMYTQTLDALALYSGSLLNQVLPKILQANDMEQTQNQYGVKSDPLNKVLNQQDFSMIQSLGQSIKILISQLFPQQTLAMQKQWDDNKKIQELFTDSNQNKYNNSLNIYSNQENNKSNQITGSINNQKVVHLGETSKLVRRITLPQREQRVNFYDILIGPGNQNQKKMEEQTGCKIIVKGVLPNQVEEPHVIVIGESEESINYAEDVIQRVISSDQQMNHHQQQSKDQQSGHVNFQKSGVAYNQSELQDHWLTPYGPPSKDAYVIKIPSQIVGLIIGKGGETIRSLSAQSGAKIQVGKADIPNQNMRNVFIEGAIGKYHIASELIMKIVEDHKKNQQQLGQNQQKEIYLPTKDIPNINENQVEFAIPLNLTGMVIGKGGDTLKSLMQRSGAIIEVPKNFDPSSGVRILTLKGSDQLIEKAKHQINTLLSTAKYMKSPISGQRVTLGGAPIRQPQNNNMIRPNFPSQPQPFGNVNQPTGGGNFGMMPNQSSPPMMPRPQQNQFGGMGMMNSGNPMMMGANQRPPPMMAPSNPIQYRFNQMGNFPGNMNQQPQNKQFQMPNHQGFPKNYPNHPNK